MMLASNDENDPGTENLDSNRFTGVTVGIGGGIVDVGTSFMRAHINLWELININDRYLQLSPDLLILTANIVLVLLVSFIIVSSGRNGCMKCNPEQSFGGHNNALAMDDHSSACKITSNVAQFTY